MSAYIITRNGRPYDVRKSTQDEAQAFLDNQHDNETTDYEIVEVPSDRWSDLEMHHHYGPKAFTDHNCAGNRADPMARENCAACLLDGWYPKGTGANEKALGPNVSNWQRDYVQARRPIPKKWRDAFYSYKESDNDLWKAALEWTLQLMGFGSLNERSTVQPERS